MFDRLLEQLEKDEKAAKDGTKLQLMVTSRMAHSTFDGANELEISDFPPRKPLLNLFPGWRFDVELLLHRLTLYEI